MLYKGALVLDEAAYAHAMDPDYVAKVCDVCIDMAETMKRCGRCKSVYYCSVACQRKGWETHRHECVMLAKLAEKRLVWTSVQLLLRIYLKLKRGEDGSTVMPDGSVRSFYSLTTKAAEISHNANYMSVFSDAVDHLSTVIDFTEDKKKIFFDIFCKMTMNRRSLNDHMHILGLAIYIKLSSLKIVCRANTLRGIRGNRIVLFAAEDISDFSQANFSLGYDNFSIAMRRRILQREAFFHCDCDACERPSPREQFIDKLKDGGAKCPKCAFDVSLEHDSVCPQCNHELNYAFKHAIHCLKLRLRALAPGEQPTVELVREAVAKLSVHDVEMRMFVVYLNVDTVLQVKGGYEAALKLADVFKEKARPDDLAYASYLTCLSQIEALQGKTEHLQSHMMQQLEIYNLALGKEHRVTKGVQRAIESFRQMGFF